MPLFKVNNFGEIGVSLVEKPKLIKTGKVLVSVPRSITLSSDALQESSYKLHIPKLDLVKSKEKWGLYLKSLMLNKSFNFFISDWLGATNDIFFVSFAWDYCGSAPIVYPPQGSDPSMFVIPMKKKDTRKFIGGGVTLWPPQQVVGGLNVVIIVFECNKNNRVIGKRMTDIHEAISGSKLATLIAAISTASGLATGLAVGSAVVELIGVIGKIMKNDGDDYVDLFEGSYGTDKQQTARVEKYDQDAAGIELELTISH